MCPPYLVVRTRTLWRPVGLQELRLILEGDGAGFPARLPDQPIFYPVLNFEYAEQIAREWNAPREPDFAGFVTRFDVDAEYLSKFPEQRVGASKHLELWVPAEELTEFNKRILGPIQVEACYYGSGYAGPAARSGLLAGVEVRRQLARLAESTDLAEALREDRNLVVANFRAWHLLESQEQGLDQAVKAAALRSISGAWTGRISLNTGRLRLKLASSTSWSTRTS